MESEGKVTFEDWTYLQKCLKYEKLRLSHGNHNIDEIEKKELLSKLEDLHREYYEHQLKVRDFQEINDYKKRLIPDAHAFLGDSFRYVEAFILQIRTKPDIFAFIASSCRQRRDKIDGLVESFGFSFFLDLVHPENTELELLNAIHRILKEELVYLRDSGHVSNLLNENLVLRKMLILYMKRKNQRKYMKLVFKKSLREIIHDQERIKELTLDPKQIYKAETEKIRVYQKEEPAPVKKKTGLFSRRKAKEEKKEEISPIVEVSEAEAMANQQVLELIEGRSQVIIDHCKSLLQSLYKNVRTMPYGLRGICKQTIALIDELVCGVSDAEKYSLLGNMLFTFWWIPAIIDPIKNGLLQNVMIHKVTLGYLKTIGTIFKNIFKESEFDEPQYFVINSFIKEESVHMKEFFRDIIYLEEGEDLWRKSSVPLYPLPCKNISEDQKNRGTMCNYYLTALTRPKISPFNFHSKTRKQAENMSEIKEFKVITSVLSIEDVKFLARIVKEQEVAVTEKGWNDLLRYAKVISKADETDSLFQSSYAAEICLNQNEIPYLFFMKKNFGDIENSYIANLHKSQSNFPKTADFEGEKLLAKVKDATRNLLGCLDMSIFFDLSKEWSLKDIAEFVIQFSYLFENKKAAQEGVPLKLLAQFLATYLKSVPEDYIAYNFRKLYTTLQKECEDRFETLRRAANKNKKLLLLAVNFMEKHVSDIKLEVKVQESLQRKAYFIQFIKDGRVPACLLTLKEGNYNTVQVYSQQICPHSKLQSVGDFVLGGRGSKSIKTESTHIFSIEEFYQRFMKLDQVVQSTENVDDHLNVGGAFFDYVTLVKNVLKDAGLGEEDIETTCEEIEKHITSSMYHHIFPSKASIEDTSLHNKACELDWVKPEHMDIDPSNRNEDMWKFAIESLEAIDDYRAPSEKLNCLEDCMSIIVNVLSLVSSGSGGVGTDDSLPIIIYVVLKAKPKRLYSNLNYISKFRHHTKMIGLKGFVFQQFQSAASYIDTINHEGLNMDKETYDRNVEECRRKFQLA